VRYVGLPAVAQYQQAALVQAIHRAGKQVIFWRRDANSERRAVIESFIALGADGFMLNKPLSEILK
jgi:glycerophosphoryl diester phosphodiesterase